MSRKQKSRFAYQPLTCIRQVGITRQFDGTVTYTFAAQVSKALAPVTITLTLTEKQEMQVQARFDEAMKNTFSAAEEEQPLQKDEKSA